MQREAKISDLMLQDKNKLFQTFYFSLHFSSVIGKLDNNFPIFSKCTENPGLEEKGEMRFAKGAEGMQKFNPLTP